MSFITRRGLSTLIPPKIASPSAVGGTGTSARMERVVGFYEKLPRGEAPAIKPKGPIESYQARYFGKKSSGTPIVQVVLGILGLGYGIEYYFHLRHHKNNAH